MLGLLAFWMREPRARSMLKTVLRAAGREGPFLQREAKRYLRKGVTFETLVGISQMKGEESVL